jgi:hypothetical protein
MTFDNCLKYFILRECISVQCLAKHRTFVTVRGSIKKRASDISILASTKEAGRSAKEVKIIS